MERHYLKIQDGITELKSSEDGTLVALWDRVLSADEIQQIYQDEDMTFMLTRLNST